MNLLKETLEKLKQNGKTAEDVKWVGSETHKTTWVQFASIADTDYDNSFGSAEVAEDLFIVGDNWWLERREYDGSEWWEYKSIPVEPETKIELKALTIGQAEKLNIGDMVGWKSLLEINGLKSKA